MNGREYLELIVELCKDELRVEVATRMLRDGDHPEGLASTIKLFEDNVDFEEYEVRRMRRDGTEAQAGIGGHHQRDMEER